MLVQHKFTSVLAVTSEILFPQCSDLEAIDLLLLTVNSTGAACFRVSGLEDVQFTQNSCCKPDFSSSVWTLSSSMASCLLMGSGSCDLLEISSKQDFYPLCACIVLSFSLEPLRSI